ncbi:MAG TPA: hypothetical protein VF996_01175 [Candidatus Saccharimonadales bacterium]|jgi:hypothetical protein
MHVREVPRQIFNELTAEPQRVVPANLAKEIYPDSHREFNHSSNPVMVGKDVAWLCLDDNPDNTATILSVHGSFNSAALYGSYQGIGQIIAGQKHTGSWSIAGGSQVVENVWVHLGRDHLNLERGVEITQLGKIACMALSKIESGLYETSYHWEDDIDTSSLG